MTVAEELERIMGEENMKAKSRKDLTRADNDDIAADKNYTAEPSLTQ